MPSESSSENSHPSEIVLQDASRFYVPLNALIFAFPDSVFVSTIIPGHLPISAKPLEVHSLLLASA